MDEDWDILTILDACRYDTFAKLSNLPGELQKRQSMETSTANVLRENFDRGTYHDTVYVTAMPVLYNGQNNQFVGRDPIRTEFHDQIDVWDAEGWDDEFRTVLPETLLEHALEAAERYPNKRLIIHFSQPHCPFIGETGNEKYSPDKRSFWRGVMHGTTDSTYIQEAYRENLEAVLPAVAELIQNVEGKHVVTSDHGQALGDRAFPIPNKEWGHPPHIFMDELINVPWLEYQNGRRRDIVSEEREGNETIINDGVVEDRLADLGYINS